MNEALFHPEFGYYNQKNPFGKEGDFVTAPEISQVFGELISAYLINLWQSNYSGQKINLVEMGAGKGTLIKDVLNFAQKIPDFFNKVNISIVEISPKLREVQKRNLSEFQIDWHQDFASFYAKNNEDPIFFISNELFDCFAINQFVKTENGVMQRMVGLDENDELQFVAGKAFVNEEVKNKLKKNGDIFEFSPNAENFMNDLTFAIKKTGGIALIIDYGYLESGKNTLQAVKNHQYLDVLKEVGNADITALVDFPNLANIALKNQLEASVISQREFLLALGIETRREKLLAGKSPEQQKDINSSIDRLIDEKQMGDLFKVLICW
ncbi:MAG: SAM-dependent MidA family methyltransferase [Rickettsiales bacterium]|jgi:SAM-dependent MidA family methyltransferase